MTPTSVGAGRVDGGRWVARHTYGGPRRRTVGRRCCATRRAAATWAHGRSGLLFIAGPWWQHRWSTGAVIPYVRMRGCGGALVRQPTLIRHKLHESRRKREMWRGALSSCPCLIHPQCHGVLWMLLLLCSCELGLSVKRYAGIPATPSAPEARARLAVSCGREA